MLADALSRAAYSGVTQKCINLLVDFKMCCSSTNRADPQGSEVSSTDPAECSMGVVDQDSKELPAIML